MNASDIPCLRVLISRLLETSFDFFAFQASFLTPRFRTCFYENGFSERFVQIVFKRRLFLPPAHGIVASPEHFEEQGKYRALPRNPPDCANREPYHDLEWRNGALYTGMDQWRKVADDPKYTQWLMEIGERNNWKLHRRPYHADDHTVVQLDRIFWMVLLEDVPGILCHSPSKSLWSGRLTVAHTAKKINSLWVDAPRRVQAVNLRVRTAPLPGHDVVARQ
jgi:hypothetical protein